MANKFKLVYIAGPFRGDIEANIKAAQQMAGQVLHKYGSKGIFPIVPHNLSHGFYAKVEGCSEEEYWVPGTLEVVRRTDAVLLVFPTADEVSSGTKGEVEEAGRLGIPVFRQLSDDILTILD